MSRLVNVAVAVEVVVVIGSSQSPADEVYFTFGRHLEELHMDLGSFGEEMDTDYGTVHQITHDIDLSSLSQRHIQSGAVTTKTRRRHWISRRKQQKDDEDERLLSIFKQIHINLPFLEAMIHILKGAKVLKDLLSQKEKLEKAASSVKLSEECSAIIQRSLPQKEGDPRSFTLPCLIGPLTGLQESIGESRQIHLPSRFRNFKDGRRRASPDHFGTVLPRHGKVCDRRTRGKIEFKGQSENITSTSGNLMKIPKHSHLMITCTAADHMAFKLIPGTWSKQKIMTANRLKMKKRKILTNPSPFLSTRGQSCWNHLNGKP
ncbi:hypothetical protein Tco_0856516 [Tanacetum coccineum]|uniref:Uncharacterized protein n=1 Tax=Tanacetum coccineum TaxID=301880 RepID=A0ABQ5B983_9ASTR